MSTDSIKNALLEPEPDKQRRHSWGGRNAGIDDIPEMAEPTKSRKDLSLTARRRRELKRTPGVWDQTDRTLFKGDSSVSEIVAQSKLVEDRPQEKRDCCTTWGLRRRPNKIENKDNKPNDTNSPQTAAPKRRSGITSCATANAPSKFWSKKNTVRFSGMDDSAAEPATPPDINSKAFRNRRATVYYSSSGRPSVMERKHPARIALEAKEGKALEQTKDICRDYIVHRLQQRKLASRVIITRQQSASRALSCDVIFIASELERLHKNLYSDVSKQIGITLRSEDVLRKVFFELAGEILTTEAIKTVKDSAASGETKKEKARAFVSSGSRTIEISWGRICAVVAIAGGLSIDCVNQGHSDLVNQLIEFCGEFASEEGVLRWIVTQGGWETLRQMTDDHTASNTSNDYGYLAQFCNVALALTACTLATVLSVVAIASVSDTAG